MEHVGEFLSAIWHDLLARISGITSFALTVLGSLWSNPLPKYSFWVAALFSLLFTLFRVWETEHSSALANKKINEGFERRVQETTLAREKAETEKLERENRRAREEHAKTLLDKALLDYLTENFRELERQGVFFANFVPDTIWLQNAAKELNTSVEEIYESLGRLKASGKYGVARALAKGT